MARTVLSSLRRALHATALLAAVAFATTTGLAQAQPALTVTDLALPTINSGGATLLPQLAPFANDVEAQKLYVIFFGRPADAAGLANFAAALTVCFSGGAVNFGAYSTNACFRNVVDSFGNSTEFNALAGPSATQIVNYFYTTLFGHLPDMNASLFWATAITNGSLTRGAAGLAISNSATSTDLTTLNNKYAAATLFTRSLDTTAEQAGYSGAASAAAGRAYLTPVMDNTSYASAIAPTALLESLNIACGFGPRSTYDGSTGVLSVIGKNFLSLAGPNNDIDVSKLTISGDGTPYTLTSASVDITSDTRFSITLNAADRAALLTRLTQNGDASVGAVAYNLAAADHWAMGVDPAINVADLTGNGIVVTNFIASLPQCTPGTWSVSGTVPCDPASPGYYVNVVGATSQTPCTAGSYQTLPGQTSCNPADPGNYVSVAAASTQTPCAAGTYQVLPGQTSCTPASLGYYVPTAGAILQIPCPLGTTTMMVGATSCVALPILNIDNSDAGTGYDAATDGVLLLRYLFGLRGTALVANARGAGVSLRDAAQIEAHIATYLTLFDVDADSQTLAMTDGLMILRRLLNPSAPTTNTAAMAAITAAAKNNPGRTDAAVVNAIDALKP